MKLIQTKKYLLLIDEEAEIKEGDYGFSEQFHDLNTPTIITIMCLSHKEELKLKKVIAYYPLNSEAKELDLPWLPPFEDPLKTLINSFNQNYNRRGEYYLGLVDGAKLGYKAAQSKQLELLKRAIQLASDAENIEEVTEEIIQSLSTQQLPSEFIPEYEDVFNKTDSCSILDNNYHTHSKKLKTITNSEGKEVLVGEYKY